jgi:hypothetical protein
MTEFVEFLIWMGIGTSGGLVIAVIFYLIGRHLHTRDDRKEAKKGGTYPAGESAHPLGACSPNLVEGAFGELRPYAVLRSSPDRQGVKLLLQGSRLLSPRRMECLAD